MTTPPWAFAMPQKRSAISVARGAATFNSTVFVSPPLISVLSSISLNFTITPSFPSHHDLKRLYCSIPIRVFTGNGERMAEEWRKDGGKRKSNRVMEGLMSKRHDRKVLPLFSRTCAQLADTLC